MAILLNRLFIRYKSFLSALIEIFHGKNVYILIIINILDLWPDFFLINEFFMK